MRALTRELKSQKLDLTYGCKAHPVHATSVFSKLDSRRFSHIEDTSEKEEMEILEGHSCDIISRTTSLPLMHEEMRADGK